MTLWEGSLSIDQAWAKSERIWILSHCGLTKKATCGVYLRTESSKNSRNYEENKELLGILSKEILDLVNKDFEIDFMGDFIAFK